MSTTSLPSSACVEWAVASRTLPGEEHSGDLHLVAACPDGILAAVIDGLGHGKEAHAAAQAAVETISRTPGEPPIALIRRCHEALKTTRGAVMTLVALRTSDDTLTALGIGNVEAVLLRGDARTTPARENLLLRNGVVGCVLPALQESVLKIFAGDVIVFATDGIRESFAQGLRASESARQLVDQVMQRDFKGSDDALVLAVRYLGGPRG
jgi:negative regulator of sigma-B (phosphoserine phosphatase)